MNNVPEEIADLSPEEKRALLQKILQEKAGEYAREYPLSHGQRALWFMHRLAPDSWAYNVLFAARIRSDLDMPSFKCAFQALLDRHPSLRTTYLTRNGEPVQQVHDSLKVHIEEKDASTWSRQSLYDNLVMEARRPFDLETGPVLRVNLLHKSSKEHFLSLTVHHIAIDGWSVWICMDELCALYRSAVNGMQASLPPTRLQYKDYVRWQMAMLEGQVDRRLLSYWEKQLSGELPVLNLPTDRPRPSVQTYHGASYKFRLDKGLTQQLKLLAQVAKTSLYINLLSTFFVLLYRYTDQDDILVGSPTSGRSRSEFENIVGYFANPVVLRADLSGNPTFRSFISQVRQTVLKAIEHQDYPFPLLVEKLQPIRDPSRAPLFQVLFAFEKPHILEKEGASYFILGESEGQMELGGLVLEPLPVSAQQEGQFDLTLVIAEVDGVLSASFDYNTDLFDVTTIIRMAGHFKTLLESALANPEQRISYLPMLTKEERHQMVEEWNDTQRSYPEEKCIHQIFEAQVDRVTDTAAVVFQDAQLTYRELNVRANQLAHYLRKIGVGAEVQVGICVERSLEMIVGLLGILKAGGAFVPLDPAYPEKRLEFMLQDSKVPVLLTQDSLLQKMPKHPAYTITLDKDWETISRESQAPPANSVTPDNLAYVIYTSGSTGKPKGVLVAHRGLCNVAKEQGRLFNVHSGQCVLQFSSLSYDASIFETVMALHAGASLCLGTRESLLPGPALLRLLRDRSVSIVTLPPSALLNIPVDDLPALQTITVAGEACSEDLVQRWANGRRFFNLYGPTETTIWATVAECVNKIGTPPIGRPISNTRIYILDSHLQPVPVGVPGELHVGGVGLARGYHNQPELTAERFIPDPFSGQPGARLYKTGDLARYHADGNIEFLGRIDYQVKIRGFRVELQEIEAVLRQHPDIRESVVLAREDVPGEKRLIAYIVADLNPALSAGTVRSFMKERLPDFMHPAAFVFLEALPVSPNGKVDRNALPVPDGFRQIEEAYVAPQTDVERAIADIWKEALHLDNVGIHDNFFDLGGNSLLMARVNARLIEITKRNISIVDMFRFPTISSLAGYLSQEKSKPSDHLEHQEHLERMKVGKNRLKQKLQQRVDKKETE